MNNLDQRTVEAILKFSADEKSASDVRKVVEDLRSQMEKSSKSMASLDKIGETMMTVGIGMNAAGSALIATMVGGSQKYIQTMGIADEYSAKWLYNSERIEQTQVRLGRLMTEAINPGFELMADAAEKVAQVAEQNPWIAKAAATGGAILSGAGALTGALGVGVRSISTLTSMAESGGAAGMAAKGTMMLGTVTLMATSVIIGAELGAALGNKLGKEIYGDEYKEQTVGDALMTAIKGFQIPGQYAALGLRESGVISEEQGADLAGAINNLNTWLGAHLGATDATVPGLPSSSASQNSALVSQQVVESYRGYVEQMSQMEKDFERQRSEIIEQFGKQRVQLEQQYATQVSRTNRNFKMQMEYSEQDWSISRSRSLRDFNLSESQVEKSYYESRSRMSESYHESIRHAEQDHQKQMSRLLEDFNDRMEDLNDRRDALGMKKEREAYLKSRDRSEEDFSTSISRSSKEYAAQLKEMEANFKEQRILRKSAFDRQRSDQEEDYNRQRDRQLEQHNIQLADMAEDHARQMKLLQENQDDTLKKLKEGYDRQLELMRAALIDRIRALDPIILGDYQAYTRYLQGLSKQFQDWMASQKSFLPETSTPSQVRRFGGYAAVRGSYELAETNQPEFVLSPESTRAAEQAVGGGLTQAAIVGGLSNSNQRGSIVVSQTLEIHGSFSDSEKAWLQSRIANVAKEATTSVIRRLVQ